MQKPVQANDEEKSKENVENSVENSLEAKNSDGNVEKAKKLLKN